MDYGGESALAVLSGILAWFVPAAVAEPTPVGEIKLLAGALVLGGILCFEPVE